MPNTNQAKLLRFAPLAAVGLALLFVSFLCVLGMLNGLQHRRQLIWNFEVAQAKSHAERTVVRIEWEIRDGKPFEQYMRGGAPDWLIDHWQRFIVETPGRAFAAMESKDGKLLAHSGDVSPVRPNSLRSRQVLTGTHNQHSNALKTDLDASDDAPNTPMDPGGQSKQPSSKNPIYPQITSLGVPLPEFGPYITQIHDQVLARGKDSIDIRLPIQSDSGIAGYYHTAIDTKWLNKRVSQAQEAPIRASIAVMLLILLTVIACSVSLFRLGSHTMQLEQALQFAETRRLADLSRLIVGMAHELRNPLNAVRLNLFTSEKLVRGESAMPKEDAIAMLHESVSEVERVNEIINQLLGYARVRTEDRTWMNLDQGIQSTLQFMHQIHEHHGIKIEYESAHPEIEIYFEQKYFRQVLLNLLHNAQQAMPDGGRIRVAVEMQRGMARMTIDDDGQGIQSDHYDRIFEPFYSTRQDGVGLGLAVVRNLIEQAGGKVNCSRSILLDGMSFSILIPARLNALSAKPTA